MRNHSYENDFDLHENETACRTHLRMKVFTFRPRFEAEAQENSEMAYFFQALISQLLSSMSDDQLCLNVFHIFTCSIIMWCEEWDNKTPKLKKRSFFTPYFKT